MKALLPCFPGEIIVLYQAHLAPLALQNSHKSDKKEIIAVTLGKFRRIQFDFSTEDDSERQGCANTAIRECNIPGDLGFHHPERLKATFEIHSFGENPPETEFL